MVECLVLDQGWDLDNAIEHLTYNVWEAYINEYTPLYLEDYDVMFQS